MLTQRIGDFELNDLDGLRYAFPIAAEANSAVVYFELDPGAMLETHTDSAEEILLVLEGSVVATVGDESGTLETGGMAVVPAHVPHGARNEGDETARVVGFFTAGTIVSHFAEPFAPGAPTQLVNGSPVIPAEVPSTLPV